MYKLGSVVFGNWTIKRKIGEGSFGRVFEIQREDFGQTYRAALKVITVPQSEAELQGVIDEGMTRAQAEDYFYSMVEDIVREFAIMAKLKGTGNVVNYEDHTVICHADGIGWDILIRMELLNSLLPYAYDHPFSRRNIIQLGIDICKALELCQKYNIIHRDLKPENIFVSDNGDFKLGDFGIARTIERTMSGLSKKGTYNYMAPEVYRGAEYGFSVDIYSLGIVLYRLLNKNRVPFLPPPPESITYHKREEALARRMGGEAIPKPFYAEGRLAEIVQKACSFDPKERYSSPAQMRQELEAILYEKQDAKLIYPAGDELAIVENQYASRTPERQETEDAYEVTDRTQSVFSSGVTVKVQEDVFEESRTESVFGAKKRRTQDPMDTTESAFRRKDAQTTSLEELAAKKKKKIITAAICSVVILAAVVIGFLQVQKNQREQEAAKQAYYQQIMQEATKMCVEEPERAKELYLEAQDLYPEEVEPYVSYAYALYCGREYDACVTYIEDTLALGKHYEIEAQNKLSEILGAAYFEMDDYAAAASFFRLSAAGGDITVSAMRDYAVSLGRLGDVEAADEVLARMFDAGASGDVTSYVQAEADYATEDYLAAESGFLSVLSETEDSVLQKRALRSLGELYRDCAALVRINESPISMPATKAAELLSDGIVQYGLRYDSAMWEMLALAYFEAYHTDPDVTENYLVKAADCFQRVIELGVQKDYLYSNLYTVYYELRDYQRAEEILQTYQEVFPDDYMPHALRGMMMITIENNKAQSARNYEKAAVEYEIAGGMIRGSDDATYYQQLGSLIEQLEKNGWL